MHASLALVKPESFNLHVFVLIQEILSDHLLLFLLSLFNLFYLTGIQKLLLFALLGAREHAN